MDEAIVDACCVLNLAAAGHGDLMGVLSQLDLRFHISGIALRETRVLWRVVDDERIDLPIDLNHAINACRLSPCEIETPEELDLLVELASRLKDPDATCLAIALSRGWTLATDDGKILRIAREYGARTTTTPALLKNWADSGLADQESIAQALRNIEQLANYRPKQGSAFHAWWVRFAGSDT